MQTDPNPPLSYAGFWRRLGSHFLDGVFLLPVTLLTMWVTSRSRLAELYLLLPNLLIMVVYEIYLVKRFGGTPGKVVAGIRIVKVDGSAVGYREAILRLLPQLLIGLAMQAFTISAALKMTDAEYASLDALARGQQLYKSALWWSLVTISNLWIWGEFIVMLTNERRRALHDFLAGTVVVLRAPTAPPVLSPPIPGAPAPQT